MPTQQQLQQLDPTDNLLVAATKPKVKKKPKKKKGPVVKDLFGDIMEEESQMIGDDEEDEFEDQDQEGLMQGSPGQDDDIVSKFYGRREEKAYTLTIICDPEEAGIEDHYKDYKKW